MAHMVNTTPMINKMHAQLKLSTVIGRLSDGETAMA